MANIEETDALFPHFESVLRVGLDINDSSRSTSSLPHGKAALQDIHHLIVIVAVKDRQVGLLVDAVSDILDVSDDTIQPVPETNSKEDARVFSGFLTDADQMVAMLDLERLLGAEILDQSQSEDSPVQ